MGHTSLYNALSLIRLASELTTRLCIHFVDGTDKKRRYCGISYLQKHIARGKINRWAVPDVNCFFQTSAGEIVVNYGHSYALEPHVEAVFKIAKVKSERMNNQSTYIQLITTSL